MGANITTFQDSQQLARNVTYTYRVRAFDAAGNSLPSNEASARLGGASMTTFTGWNPQSSVIGSMVNISGSNLNTVVAVQFSAQSGRIDAPFILLNLQSISTTVPTGAVTGSIVLVLNDGRITQSPVNFQVVGGMGDLPAPSNLMGAAASGSQIDLSWARQ